MTVTATLIERNAAFAEHGLSPGLRMLPALKTILIGCVDPRVDPAHVLGLGQGDGAVLRNVGGRVTPGVVRELAMLRKVTLAAGGDFGPGWEFVVLHHTDCGITRLAAETDLLATFFEIEPAEVSAKQVPDPRAAVKIDVAALEAAGELPPGIVVSGLVYDVATGRAEVVVEPSAIGS